MIEGIVGKKVGMTQIYAEGVQVSVTVIKTGPCFVTQRKTSDNDGYEALQLGFGEKKASRVTKPMAGHFAKAGVPATYHLVEFVASKAEDIKPGHEIKCADVFKVGDMVDVSATSKGRGFVGVMKRWGFSGGPGGHGSMHGRGPGSIGQSSDPSKVFKGMKMPGHKGNKKATIQNLRVMDIKAEENIMLVSGAVPGPIGAVVVINKALKK